MSSERYIMSKCVGKQISDCQSVIVMLLEIKIGARFM